MKQRNFFAVSIIFLIFSITAFLISISCKNDSKKNETVAVDTAFLPKQKVPPPLGMQGMGKQPSQAREGEVLMGALPRGVQKYPLKGTLGKEDTLVLTTIKKQFIYYATDSTIKKYNPGGTPANKPPTANAGADKIITLPTNSTSLAGSGADTDGTISTYTWSKVSGGVATITTPNAATTNVTGLVQGSYTFRLTVKDNGGLTATDDVLVTVNPAATVNTPPVSNAGTDKTITLPTNTTTLTGSGTDPDGTISTYTWTKVSGGAATIATPNAATTAVNSMVQGAYVFRLTVKDNGGSSAGDDVNVTVNAAPPPTSGVQYLSLPLSGIKDVSGQSNVIIENLRFENTSAASIKAFNASNITIRNCFFDGSSREAIDIQNSSNITITNCLFNRVESGVYALNSSTIKINNNQFVNVRRRVGDGGGRGQFVQFNSCSGAGNEIMNNQGENFPGESDPEDLISMYASSGTSTSLIKISGNTFRGGCPSASGGGIIAGDNGGGWIIIENNTLFNPGQYGSAIAGGHDIKILNNKIYSKQTECSNNPLYVWKQSDPECTNHTVTGNRVTWIDKTGVTNNGWNSGTCTNTTYDPAENQPITEAQMGVPAHLITFITPAELITIRQ